MKMNEVIQWWWWYVICGHGMFVAVVVVWNVYDGVMWSQYGELVVWWYVVMWKHWKVRKFNHLLIRLSGGLYVVNESEEQASILNVQPW